MGHKSEVRSYYLICPRENLKRVQENSNHLLSLKTKQNPETKAKWLDPVLNMVMPCYILYPWNALALPPYHASFYSLPPLSFCLFETEPLLKLVSQAGLKFTIQSRLALNSFI